VYEVASWLHLGKDLHKMYLMPVELPKVIILVHLCSAISVMVFSTSRESLSVTEIVILVLTFIFIYPAGMHILRGSIRHLRNLPAQLAEFSVKDSECFCCQNEHRHPETGHHLPCDRQVVYGTLRTWFSQAQENHSSMSLGCSHYLDRFDLQVREEVAEYVARTVGGARVSYTHTLIASLPWLWRTFDKFSGLGGVDGEIAVRMIGEHLCVSFVVVPCCFSLAVELVVVLDKKLGKLPDWRLDALVSVAAAAMEVLLIAAIYVPLRMSVWSTGFALQLAWTLGLIIAIAVLHHKYRCRRCVSGRS